MKKLLFVLGLIILLPMGAVYCAELALDLNNGTIAGLKLGSQADRDAIIRAIGQEPDDVEESFNYYREYKYYSCGLFIGSKVVGDKESIEYFTVYLEEEKGKDRDYKRFSGKIFPQLSASDDINSVKNKLGLPQEEGEFMKGSRHYELLYEKPYGYVTLIFGDNKLLFIEISIEYL